MPANKTTYKKLSDSKLIDLLRNSDHAAFAEIFDRFGVLLFSIAQRRLNDKELSKDLIQDVFANIWEKRTTVNIPGNLQSFLITVVKNRILDHYKHNKVTQKYIDNFQNYLKTTESKTDHLIRHNDMAALIEKEIAALPEKMRSVFELSRKSYLSRKEISEYLGVPEGNVKINMQRALKTLKFHLGTLLTPFIVIYLEIIRVL